MLLLEMRRKERKLLFLPFLTNECYEKKSFHFCVFRLHFDPAADKGNQHLSPFFPSPAWLPNLFAFSIAPSNSPLPSSFLGFIHFLPSFFLPLPFFLRHPICISSNLGVKKVVPAARTWFSWFQTVPFSGCCSVGRRKNDLLSRNR